MDVQTKTKTAIIAIRWVINNSMSVTAELTWLLANMSVSIIPPTQWQGKTSRVSSIEVLVLHSTIRFLTAFVWWQNVIRAIEQ